MNYEEIKRQIDEDYYKLFAKIKKAEREMLMEWTKRGSLYVYDLNFRMAHFTNDGDVYQDRVEVLEDTGSVTVRDSEGERWKVNYIDWVTFEVASLIDQIKARLTSDPKYLDTCRKKYVDALNERIKTTR